MVGLVEECCCYSLSFSLLADPRLILSPDNRFFIKENLLSTISFKGLEISKNISNMINTIEIFKDYSTFTITEKPRLYCSMQFNFYAISGIIVYFDLSLKENGK